MDKIVKANQAKQRKEIEAINEKIQKSKLKPSDLVIPIAIGMILIILTIFVFIPMVTSALDSQDELKDVKGKIETLKDLDSRVSSLDQGVLSDDVITAKAVIPRVLKVSEFIYYVDDLASKKGLVANEISAGDSGAAQISTSSVSGPVEYSGSWNAVLDFVEEIHTVSPYVVTLKNVELSGKDDSWTVSVDVTGFYMSEENTNVSLYSTFRPYTGYSEVLEIFNSKADYIQ